MAKSYLCIPESAIMAEKAVKWLCKQEKQKDIARAIGMSEQLFSYKKRTCSFTIEEFISALHYVNAEEGDLKKIILY